MDILMAVLASRYSRMFVFVTEGAFELTMLRFALGEHLKYIRVTGPAIFIGYIAGIMNI